LTLLDLSAPELKVLRGERRDYLGHRDPVGLEPVLRNLDADDLLAPAEALAWPTPFAC
jgi:hypothetical protein